jgi:asparagine synthase (glutamine-hydrolysing)
MLFGVLLADVRETPLILDGMAAALRVTEEEQITLFNIGGIGIGVLERPAGMSHSAEPAQGDDGSYLWMSGEAFDWPSRGGIRTAADSRTAAFRRHLLDAITSHGPEVISDLDGEYQIALWNPHRRSLLLLNDRFGALPLYIGASRFGTAFAGGVRGVLMAPGIDTEPDVDAIREAVSFGGYRLAGRTNVRSVSMMSPATAATLTAGRVAQRRYWTWRRLQDGDAADDGALITQARTRWTAAIARRLDGSRRPGLTLSGGMDSRAILAEVSQQCPSVTALTYGVPHADDVTLARRAARAAGAQWQFFPLYQEGWLERRTAHILGTDGLVDLVDLMHTEALDRMPAAFDVYLSGYIGDVVAGSTWYIDDEPGQLLGALPYYGGPLAIPYDQALTTARELIAATPGAPRFALYEHKAPQSTNRVTAAARPYVTVRRPFVDYSFFELCQRMPAASRCRHGWRERWLLSMYPELFGRIPNQQSGVPAGSSRTRWHVTRVARYGWRRMLRTARSAGLPVVVPDRSYHPDERYWSAAAERSQIERTIMRPGSISCEVFGRSRLESTLRHFFDHVASPVQVIGTLYVFEHYHQTLSAALGAARQTARAYAC